MIKLLKKMGKREVLMAVLCALLVLGQVYFDLTLPDYMTDLTMMLNTAGSETSDILNVGLKMLGCTLQVPLLLSSAAIFPQRLPQDSATQ